MGGCRCSYRNCSVRSDGVTHMFHYPVFDKVRCHQWLTNAHKLEFLILKVSQLKNRVICQHHFRDECFMNFKKDKLTFHAVPTLDGPYCDASQYDIKSSEVLKRYPITLDDIENEILTFKDKQANFSVKYGDFLTNFDMMDVDPVSNIDNNSQIMTTKNSIPKAESQSIQYNKMVQNNNNNKLPAVNIKSVSEFPSKEEAVSEVQYANPLSSNTRNQTDLDSSPTLFLTNLTKIDNFNTTKSPAESRIRILSEKKISEPVKIIGKCKQLSPSSIIRAPDIKNKTKICLSEVIDLENKSNCNNEMPLKGMSNDSSVLKQPTEQLQSCLNQTLQVSDSVIQDNPRKKIKIAIKSNSLPSNKLISKSKVNSERVAAITEKRKFNMKLRDIVASCLDKIDNDHKNDKNSETNTKLQTHKNIQVGTFLSPEPELPNLQEYTIACLQARIERMENLLLNKIERNSQRIVDLKNSFNSSSKISKCTQTAKNEEAQKRQLYKEISQYLSPNLNSLLYEELFINKCIQNTPKTSPLNKKRRKKGYVKK